MAGYLLVWDTFKNLILEAHLSLLNYLISQEAKFLRDQKIM